MMFPEAPVCAFDVLLCALIYYPDARLMPADDACLSIRRCLRSDDIHDILLIDVYFDC